MPRHGIGIDISTLAGSEGVVTTIDDFVFESFSAGQMHPILTTSRTNLIPYSNEFTNSSGTGWIKSTDYTLAANDIISPDGTQNATKVTLPAGNGALRTHNMSVSPNTSYVFSFFAKRGTASEMKYRVFDFTDPYVDIVSKTSYYSQTNTDTWVRIEVPFTTSSATNVISVYIDSDGSGDGYFYAYGAQLEQDGFASAYIPTSGSAVTVSTTLNDTSNVWDFDGTDIMIAEDPEDEGFWEESYPNGATLPELVLNGDYEDLGSELVTNGDFATDSNWSKGTGWSIANGKATHAGGSSNTYINQLNTTTVGKVYKAVFTLSGGLNATNYIQTYGSSAYPDFTNQYTSAGTYTLYFTADATFFRFRAVSPDNDVSVDNVSVKQVDPNDRWNVGDGWSIEDGKAKCDGSQSGSADLLQSSITTGKDVQYEITYTVSNYSAGTIKVRLSSGNTTAEQSSNGTFTEIITATAAGGFRLRGNSSFVGSVDNVSVKEYAIQPLDI